MNTSSICLSLKYLSKNYELLSNVSKWFYLELEKYNYKQIKFINSLFNEDFEIIKTLIKFNKDIKLLSEYLIYFCSCKNNFYKLVKLLIDNGANIHENNDLALIHAIGRGHYNIVKLLIDNGADIFIEHNYALRLASSHGYLNIIKLLIKNGADTI